VKNHASARPRVLASQAMWRGVRADRVVHDEYFAAMIMALVPVGLVVLCVASFVDPAVGGQLVSLGMIVVGSSLRRRTEVARTSKQVRVSWVLAPVPTMPGLTLRMVDERPISAFSEVLVDTGESTGNGRVHPVALSYADPMRRHGAYVERLRVARFGDRNAALRAARRLAEDMGLPARDVAAKDERPAVAPLEA
jgi:hypothetical protein